MYTYIFVYICIYVYKYICICICIYTYTLIYVRTHVCMHEEWDPTENVVSSQIPPQLHKFMQIFVCMHACVYVLMHCMIVRA